MQIHSKVFVFGDSTQQLENEIAVQPTLMQIFFGKVPKVTLHKTISRMRLECYEYFKDLAPFCE